MLNTANTGADTMTTKTMAQQFTAMMDNGMALTDAAKALNATMKMARRYVLVFFADGSLASRRMQ